MSASHSVPPSSWISAASRMVSRPPATNVPKRSEQHLVGPSWSVGWPIRVVFGTGVALPDVDAATWWLVSAYILPASAVLRMKQPRVPPDEPLRTTWTRTPPCNGRYLRSSRSLSETWAEPGGGAGCGGGTGGGGISSAPSGISTTSTPMPSNCGGSVSPGVSSAAGRLRATNTLRTTSPVGRPARSRPPSPTAVTPGIVRNNAAARSFSASRWSSGMAHALLHRCRAGIRTERCRANLPAPAPHAGLISRASDRTPLCTVRVCGHRRSITTVSR